MLNPETHRGEKIFLHLFQIKQTDEPFCVSTNVRIIMIEGAALHVYIMDVHVEPTMMLKDPMK